jgi:hypothetical protein
MVRRTGNLVQFLEYLEHTFCCRYHTVTTVLFILKRITTLFIANGTKNLILQFQKNALMSDKKMSPTRDESATAI